MHEELEKAVSAGKLTPKSAESLDKLQPGTYCLHKSWGFGRIAEWNMLTGQVLIDFKGKKGHPMQLQYAAENLQPVPSDHFLAQAAENPENTKTALKNEPVKIVTQILQNTGGKATVDQISNLIVPDLMDAAAFKRWWDSAKKKLKADGHFSIPAKKTDPIVLRDAPLDQTSELFDAFNRAKQLKQQVTALDQITKNLGEFANAGDALRDLTAQVQESARKSQKLHPGEAIELLLGLEEIRAKYPDSMPAVGITIAHILRAEEARLPEIFAQLPASKQRRVLAELIPAFEDTWPARAHRLFRSSNARLVSEIARFFEEQNRAEEIAQSLERMISDRSSTTEILYWISKERGAQYPQLFQPDLFSAILHALEYDQTESISRSSRLHDLVMEDRELISDLLATAHQDGLHFFR